MAQPAVVAVLEPGLEKRATRLCSPDRHSKAPEERSAGPCTSAPGSSACVCGASLAPTPCGGWQAQIPAGHSTTSCTMSTDGCHSAPLWRVRPTLLHYSLLSAARSKRQSAGRAGLLAGTVYSHSPGVLCLRRLLEVKHDASQTQPSVSTGADEMPQQSADLSWRVSHRADTRAAMPHNVAPQMCV